MKTPEGESHNTTITGVAPVPILYRIWTVIAENHKAVTSNKGSEICNQAPAHDNSRNLHLKPSPSPTVSASGDATPTTSIEIDKSPLSATPSKLLPFRVGHGFDLHQLEPGCPLIIGGINILHDRGCEAHSDENERMCWVLFFLRCGILTHGGDLCFRRMMRVIVLGQRGTKVL